MSFNPSSFLAIIGLIINISVLLIAFKQFKKSIEKDNNERFDKKLDIVVFKDFKEEHKCQSETIEINNSKSHAEMKAEISMMTINNNEAHKQLKADFIDKVNDFKEYVNLGFNSIEKKIDILIQKK
jgi:preprotein translocase subunit SecF